MKNYVIKRKALVLTIICSVVCIILIRDFNMLGILDFNNYKKLNFKNNIIIPIYTKSPSNKLPYTTVITSNNKQFPTLSPSHNKALNINSSKRTLVKLNTTIPHNNKLINAHLPDYLMYKNVNTTNLKEFLNSKNSLLVEEPYFTTILSVSKDFNLNPLIMFAITGQEQSFVPKTDKNANKIANNPFNVFCSWKKYNTSIKDASIIAARTLVNLCKNKPPNMDAFTWINQKYSEDTNWSKAVRSIFKELEGNISYWK